MKLVIGSYVIDNVSNTAYEDFITYYNGTPASYITQNDIDKWNTPTDLSAYAKFSDISAMGYVTSTDYNSDQEIVSAALNDLSYKVNHIDIPEVDLSSYTKFSDISDMGYITINDVPQTDLSSYVTYDYLSSQSYLTQHQSLSDYPTFNDISDMGYITSSDIPSVDLSGYITNTDYNSDQEIVAAALNDLSYKINHIDIPEVDLSSYATISYVTDEISNIPSSPIVQHSFGYCVEQFKGKYSNIGYNTFILSDGISNSNNMISAYYSLSGGGKIQLLKGTYNFSWGFNNIVGGDYITMFGSNHYSNYVSGRGRAKNGFAAGDHISIMNPYQAAFGTYNLCFRDEYNYPQYTYEYLYPYGFYKGCPLATNSLFSVGNGRSNMQEHNAFDIRQNGDIWIPYNTNAAYDDSCAYRFSMMKIQDFISYTYSNINNTNIDLSSYATKAELSSYLTVTDYNNDQEIVAAALNDLSYKINHIDIPSGDLSSYVTYDYLSAQSYLTQHQDLSDYPTFSDISSMGYITSSDVVTPQIDLSSYATISYVTYEIEKNELVTAAALTNLSYNLTNLENSFASIVVPELDLSSYATKAELSSYVSSSTAGIKIEIVSSMPVSPDNNTIYLVQAS